MSKPNLSVPTGKTDVKRSTSLRDRARRLSGSRRYSEASVFPTRRKGLSYVNDPTDYSAPTSPVDSVALQINGVNLDVHDPEEKHDPLSPTSKTLNIPEEVSAPLVSPVQIPDPLIHGLELMRVTHKKHGLRTFRINPHTFELYWDTKSTSRFTIESIEDIREGEAAKFYRESLKISSSLSSRWATIFYTDQRDPKNKPRLLHIVAQSMEDFRMFLNTLKVLGRYRHAQNSVPGFPQDVLLENWKKVAFSMKTLNESCVNIHGVQQILEIFYVYCSRAFLQSKFSQVDVKKRGYLTFTQFQQLVWLVLARPEIEQVFKSAADIELPETKAKAVSLQGLTKFCSQVQKKEHGIDTIFERFTTTEAGESGIILADFSKMLLSESYMPLVSPQEEDLDRPLNEYLISTSHNTYLVGRQLAGISSIEPYISVLENGCRCVELDVWDGEDGPIVNHGRTFTASVSFESVIDTINQYGFRASAMPVILSFEIHCDFKNQIKMVEIMKRVFGEKLVTEPLMSNAFSLPSPSELKNRVLVKVKPGNNKMGTTGSANVGQAFSAVDEENDSDGSSTTSSSSESDDEEDTGPDGLTGKRNNSIVKLNRIDAAKCTITDELGDLGVYVQGIKFRNFSLPISKTVNHCFSLSEDKINDMIKDEVSNLQLVKHNKKFFLRVYPSGYRVTSSNYDPMPYWKRGAQMVSLNWQTYDRGRQLNDAMFPLTGESTGYVLKPRTSMVTAGSSSKCSYKLKITIVSACHLHPPKDQRSDEVFSPWASVELVGTSEETENVRPSKRSWLLRKKSVDGGAGQKLFRTKAIENNGLNPIWNADWSCEMSEEDYPYSFVRFGVHTEEEGMFASSTNRVQNLNQGYRHVPLNDSQGKEYIFSKLFVRIECTKK